MVYRTRIKYTPAQKEEIWDRRRQETIKPSSLAKSFDWLLSAKQGQSPQTKTTPEGAATD